MYALLGYDYTTKIEQKITYQQQFHAVRLREASLSLREKEYLL